MVLPVLAFPMIDPVLISIGPFPIRWYALSYIAGLVLGWLYARWIVDQDQLWGAIPRPHRDSLEDLLVYVAIGVVFGGRLGYVLFYNPAFYVEHLEEVVAVWKGGMAFHGGLVGAAIGIWVFAYRHQLNALSLADICATVVPIGLLLVRIANFIKPELWGRISDVPWAMVFPVEEAGPLPRHPSQLYEAGLEGFVLLILLHLVLRQGALKRPGLLTGLFGIGYGVARIICEFFREPDPQLGFLFGGATMGMLLSLPLILAGALFIWNAQRKAVQA